MSSNVSLSSLRTKSRLSMGEDASRVPGSNQGSKILKVDVRQELDHRRIADRPNTAPSPVVTLLRNNDSGPQDIGNFAGIEGPKRKEETQMRARQEYLASKTSPSKKKVVGGLTPKKGWRNGRKSRSPERMSAMDRMDSIDERNNSSIRDGVLNSSLLGTDLLNGRDQSALKLGRLLLSTILDQDDVSNKDVLSRFFFDNWLKKSGGEFKKVDTFSIEMMSRLQKQISEAKSIAIAESFSKSETEAPTTTPLNESGIEEAGVSEGKEEDNKSDAIVFLDNEAMPGEKKAIKLVGLVALNALDTCVAEFGQANPVLSDIRSGLLPLIFADKLEVDKLAREETTSNAGETAERDLDHDKKYSEYQTWIEDSHFMFDSYERSEKQREGLVDEVARLKGCLRDTEGLLKREKDSVDPLKAQISGLEQERERNLAVIEDERAKLSQMAAAIDSKDDQAKTLRREIEDSKLRERNKDDMVKELTETIAQMERDKLPDIREEYAAACRDVERLTEETRDLEDAVRSQKIMLDTNKKADEAAAASIMRAEADHQNWQQVLSLVTSAAMQPVDGEEVVEIQEGERSLAASLSEAATALKAEYDEADDDQKKAIGRRVAHFDAFFADTARAKTSARYVEYLEMADAWATEEIRSANVEKTGIRVELQRVIDNEQRLIDGYEAKLAAQAERHREEVEALRAEVRALETEVANRVAEIAELSRELEGVKKDLEQARRALAEAQEQMVVLTDENKRLVSENERLASSIAALEEELADTKEQLEDTRRELQETIEDLRETNRQLEAARDSISLMNDQISMLNSDAWMQERLDRATKRGDQLQGRLDHAQSEIANLRERVSFLDGEVRDLTAEVKEQEKAREEDQREFEIRTEGLHTQIGELELEVSQHLATIEKRDERIDFLQREREREMAGYEDTLASDVREADKLHEEVTQLTDERNALTLEKRRLEGELAAMTERALRAEEHFMGSDELAAWCNSEMRALLQNLDSTADNYNEDEFNDDDLDPVVLKVAVNNLEKAKLLDEDLKGVAIDLMVHADEATKAFVAKFKRTIRELTNALEVSRKVIQTSNSVGGTVQGNSVDEFSLHGGDSSVIQDQGSVMSRGSVGGEGSTTMTVGVPRSRSRDAYGSDGAHLEILQDGWLSYDPDVHALMRVGETPVNTEILLMMREDEHTSLHKDAVLDMIFTHSDQEAKNARALEEAEREEEEAKDDIDRSEEELGHRIRILETAAAAVEREDPLRERIKSMEAKMAAMELHEQELQIETEEAMAEAKFLKKRNEELTKTFEVLRQERDDSLAKFEQAMKALHTSQEKSKGKEEAVEEKKAEHPAMRNIKDIINANKGNPKKLVQPFVHFIRRNENEITRHLGTQAVMMREIKHLVEGIKHAFARVQDEEYRYYHRKHNSVESDQENIQSLSRVWDLVRTMTKEIDEKAPWVFETQDYSMGDDRILKALDVPEGSTVDPTRAIGENHLAAAYEAHLHEVQRGDNAELSDIIDEVQGEGENVKEQLAEGIESLAEHLRVNSKKSGGWRMELYRMDGSVDMDMPIKDWTTEDKVLILAEKLRYSQTLLQQQKCEHDKDLEKMKSQRATLEKEMDSVRDEMDRLQKEYGAVGIEHDFYVYKRIKEGILDGSLAKHNLGETIYNPADFIELETAIFKTVHLLLSLSGRQLDDEEEAPAGTTAHKTEKGGKVPPALSVAVDSKTITPAGDRPPMIVDAAPTTTGPRPTTTGSQSRAAPGKYTQKMVALASNKLPKSTRPPRNEWSERAEETKQKKRLDAHHVRNTPAVYANTNTNTGGAYSQQQRGTLPGGHAAYAHAHTDFVWSNQATKRLVALLEEAGRKISMRVLYAKVLASQAVDAGAGASRPSGQMMDGQPSMTTTSGGPDGDSLKTPGEKSDVRKFVGVMNTRINKHIQSAKLFESVVREVEEVIEGGGGLDNDSLKRIYDAKMASADATSEEKEALELMDLVIEKPPASLARSAHLVRGDHHHLVQEGQKDRKFMSSTWTGRPSSPGDDRTLQGTQQELALHASSSTASLGVDKLSRFGVLESRVGVGSRGSHIVSTPQDPRNLSLAPIDSWLMSMNAPRPMPSETALLMQQQHQQHQHHHHQQQQQQQHPLLQDTIHGQQEGPDQQSNTIHLHLGKMEGAGTSMRQRNNSISMGSEISSMSPSRRVSLESMQDLKDTGTPRVSQWEGRLHFDDSLDDDIQSQVSAPVPSTPEPKSVTLLVTGMTEASVAGSLEGSACTGIEEGKG